MKSDHESIEDLYHENDMYGTWNH